MNRILTGLALAGLTLSFAACKPTYRKVPNKPAPQQQPTQQTEQTPQQANDSPDGQDSPPQPAAVSYADCLMLVRVVSMAYNPIQPWEKSNSDSAQGCAVYIGDGKVLINGLNPENVTYVELSLPDESRTVPARVVKYDADLDLALLTVAHEQDATIFDSRKPCQLGEPMRIGDQAELWCTIDGTIPTSVPLRAESEEDNGQLPMISAKAAFPLPSNLYSTGAPVVKDGKLVALSSDYDSTSQSVACLNAEFLQRFLEEGNTVNSLPVLGVSVEQLDDPVFRRYLKLGDKQCGLYISKVLPAGAAAAAGIMEGDVLTSIEGLDLDNRGRWPHPIYGPTNAGVVISSLKPIGGQITLGFSRAGEKREVTVALNRDALENSLPTSEKPGVAPRYIVWGGLVFQPLTQQYLGALRSRAGGLPVQFLEIERNEKDMRAKGVTEIVGLTSIIPTPATLGCEQVGYSIVEKVNGKEIHNFREFEEALDTPTPDGLLHLTINRAPYNIYIDRQAAEAANDVLRRNAIHRLRRSAE